MKWRRSVLSRRGSKGSRSMMRVGEERLQSRSSSWVTRASARTKSSWMRAPCGVAGAIRDTPAQGLAGAGQDFGLAGQVLGFDDVGDGLWFMCNMDS